MRGPGQTHSLAAADSSHYRSLRCRFQLGSRLVAESSPPRPLCEGDQRTMNERFRLNPFLNKSTRSARTWLTLGTAAAYAAVSLTRSSPTWAQNATTPNTKPREQQSLSVRRLEIPAGPLDIT